MSASQANRSRRLPATVGELVSTAVHSFDGRPESFESAVAGLVRPGPDWRAQVDRTLSASLLTALDAAWRRGWQPADIARLVRRRLGERPAEFVADLIAAQLEPYLATTLDPSWPVQLAELGGRVWWPPGGTCLRAWGRSPRGGWVSTVLTAVEVLALLRSLPTIARLGPLPGSALPAAGRRPAGVQGAWGTADSVMGQVVALLARAEKTGDPARALEFTAAAQELVARRSLDAMAPSGSGAPVPATSPAAVRLGIDVPSTIGTAGTAGTAEEEAAAALLDGVARANRCRCVWSRDLGFCTVIGFTPDLEAVEVLFRSLLRQPGRQGDPHAIGARLSAATREQVARVTGAPGGSDLFPALAARDRAVRDALDAMFPMPARDDGIGASGDGGDRAEAGPVVQRTAGLAV